MLEQFKSYRTLSICILLIAVPFLFLYVNTKGKSHLNFFDTVILKISAPIQDLTYKASHSISTLVEQYILLKDLKKDNLKLRSEIDHLKKQVRLLAMEKVENIELRKLLDLKSNWGQEKIFAGQVISKSLSPYFRVMRLRIETGAKSIQRGMPVIAQDGVVGRIHKVFGNYADLMLAVDSASTIDVVIGQQNSRGILKGNGLENSYSCRVEFLSSKDRVVLGDLVYTSGLGGGFPKGIPVGKIDEIQKQDFGLWQKVKVTPVVDFSRLSEVLILSKRPE